MKTLTPNQIELLRVAARTMEILFGSDRPLLFATWRHEAPSAARVLRDMGHTQESDQLSANAVLRFL